MGTQSNTYPMRNACIMLCCARRAVWLAFLCVLVMRTGDGVSQTISALSTPLLLPTYVAFDAQGNLYLAETNHHVIRKVDTTGIITTVAGDGTQGFSGDGGSALAAQLDSPTGLAVDAANNVYVSDTHNHRVRRIAATNGIITTVAGNGAAAFTGDGVATQSSLDLPSALALDASGNLYIADANNHRIRKVTAANGTITTVAGSGQQGFTGDSGPATAAALDSPGGLAVDAAANLYIADTRNHRVRMVDAATGIIVTLAGTGSAGFSGDNAAATGAALALPRGITVDAAGTVTIADSNNDRIRRISSSGMITTIAGDGTQAFVGDGGQALLASLDSPRSTVLSSEGLVTVADTGNQRVRQVASDSTIATIAGLGAIAGETLSLAGPASVVYGTGSLTAMLASSVPGTGDITFFAGGAAGATPLGAGALVASEATLSTASLSAGTYQIYASYAGDPIHAAAESATMTLLVTQAPLTATVNLATILYGQSVPALSGTLSGALSRDTGNVTLVLATSATTLSPAGSYPITAMLKGTAAGNYTLPAFPSTVLSIAKAPSSATLASAAQSVTVSQPVGLTVHVASTTSGIPTGAVVLQDGTVPLATLPLSAMGDASYTSSALAAGTHTLIAIYSGDGNFNPSTTAEQTVAVTSAVASDFTLATTGTSSQTVTAGSAAVFPFTVQMQGGALSSPITLAASSLPIGVTASFNPAYLPPGGAVTSFALTLQTPKPALTALLAVKTALGLCMVLLPWWGLGRRGRQLFTSSLCMGALLSTLGCGARVFAAGAAASTNKSYPITVTATATSPTGTTLVHTVTVTLTVQ